MRNQRPAALTAATVICVLNSLGNLAILPAPLPRPLVYASGLAAVAGVIGAFGLWLWGSNTTSSSRRSGREPAPGL